MQIDILSQMPDFAYGSAFFNVRMYAQPAGVKTQELENNSFPGHAGRPGQVGGSVGKGSSPSSKELLEKMAFDDADGSFGYITEKDNNMNLDLSSKKSQEMILKLQDKGKLVYDMAHDMIVVPGVIEKALEWNRKHDA